MAFPVITVASIQSTAVELQTTATLNVPLSASGNDRILIIANLRKASIDPAPTTSAITVDSAGVNRTIGAGVTQQGAGQLALESIYSSFCDVYFCLEADLPTSAGTYAVTVTGTGESRVNMWVAFEVTGCANQAYDAIVQNLTLVDAAAGDSYSETITTTSADSLIVGFWSTSHSDTPTLSTTDTLVSALAGATGGAIVSTINKAAAGAQVMSVTGSSLSQRQAWTVLALSTTAATPSFIAAWAKQSNVILL